MFVAVSPDTQEPVVRQVRNVLSDINSFGKVSSDF